MLRKLFAFGLMISIWLWSWPVFAQKERQLVQDGEAEKRIALVIGNGDYAIARKLANPVNDAIDMANTLKGLGFEVVSGTNLSLKQMSDKVREFGDKLKASGGVGLFYYAGHGIQVGGRNYLIPVEADIPREDEVDFNALNLDLILRKMATANNGLNIVILDACRNNPFARSWSRSADEGGLAQITAPTGTFIAYATAPDRTASDGTGRNGLYTTELLKVLQKPNLKIEEAFKQVTIAVDRTSGGKQIPWTSSSLRGEFYFRPIKPNVVVNPIPTDKQNEPAIVAKDRATQEKEAWDLVKNSASAADFRYFLEEFPDGANAAQAKIRLEELIWQSVRGADKAKIQAYLNEFPNGANAPAARIRLKQLEAAGNLTNPTPTNGNTTANRTAGAISKATLPGGVEMSFAYIPPGEFQMGSNTRSIEMPVHRVRISQGFWMGQTEVTQGQWEAVMKTTLRQQRDKSEVALKVRMQQLRSKALSEGNTKVLQSLKESEENYVDNYQIRGEGADYPMYFVSWDEAQEFVQALNNLNDGYKYRLPTEAEWEYAARAGTTGDYAGSLDLMGWYCANSGDKPMSVKKCSAKTVKVANGRTHPVGQKQPNAWNLYDMHGNVQEWVEDWFDENYYKSSPANDPRGPSSGRGRVARGGCWSAGSSCSKSWGRACHCPNGTGFRVVRMGL
jgi:formylglycine-generating enzyme required for sulfatase activity